MGRKLALDFKLSDYFVVFALVAMCVVISLFSPVFFTSANIMNIFVQSAVNGILAIGLTKCILTGGIDLSVGSVLCLAGIMMGFVHLWMGEANALTPLLSILAALAVGLIAGLTSGTLIAKGKLPPFIATLGMMQIARGLSLTFSGGRPLFPFHPFIRNVGGTANRMVPVAIMIMLFVIAWWVLRYTKQGRNIYAVGGNIEAARLSGINTDRVIIITYMISGVMAAIAGIVLTGRLNTAMPTAGLGFELDAIAAAVIGGTSMKGGEGRMIGTFIGALFISVLRNGLSIMNISSFFQQVVIGLVLIGAVLFDTLNTKRA